ncbi:MAG: hypothetical protein ABSF89_12870 [Acidimicrobiales bacterium]
MTLAVVGRLAELVPAATIKVMVTVATATSLRTVRILTLTTSVGASRENVAVHLGVREPPPARRA